MKACIFTFILLSFSLSAFGAERIKGAGAVLNAEPATKAGRIANRAPAALLKEADKNRAVFEKLKPGTHVIIQNSIHDYEDKVARVVDKFEDGSVRVELSNGKRAFVKAENLAATISPEIDCGDSHGTKICKGDTVFYPVRSTSLELPEAPVLHVFENGSVVVRDGGAFVLDLNQVGKAVDCSPQKESICTGSYVYARAFRNNTKFEFEGPVEKTYTHGIALVRVNGLWRYPIDVSAVNKRIETEDPENLTPAVITHRNHRGKNLPYTVTEELEPLDPHTADYTIDAR